MAHSSDLERHCFNGVMIIDVSGEGRADISFKNFTLNGVAYKGWGQCVCVWKCMCWKWEKQKHTHWQECSLDNEDERKRKGENN